MTDHSDLLKQLGAPEGTTSATIRIAVDDVVTVTFTRAAGKSEVHFLLDSLTRSTPFGNCVLKAHD